MSDLSIYKRIQDGDISAFEKVFREYYAPLTLFANSMVKDKDVAEEIVQDFFYNYWKNRDQITIQTSMKSYFFQSIKNKSLKYLRHESVKNKYATGVLESLQAENNVYQPNVYELKELETKIAAVLEKLPANCSLIFKMNRFEGFKYREIAEKLSISVKTVEANMSKALTEFRNELKFYRSH
jgi:RNA polymerase sigma-70 factor, ECF subfamily